MKKTIRLLILIFGVSSFSWQSSLAGDEGQADFSSLREDWEAAQRASVSHQGSQALKHIVGMLKLGGQDTLVQDQVASFLRRQFIRGRGKIPVTWEIPQEVTDLSLHLRSTVGSQGDYDSVHLQGQTEGAEVTGLHLWFLRGTKKYLILSNDGENKWSMLPGQKTGTYNFHLANGGRHSALTPGAYRLLIELDNGKRVRGDFVVTQEMALPPAPDGKVKLVSPKGCQVNFRWRVPEEESFRTFEAQSNTLVVFGKNQRPQWSLMEKVDLSKPNQKLNWPKDSRHGTPFIGSRGNEIPNHLLVMYSGARQFGPLKVIREAGRSFEFPPCSQ